MRQRAPPTTRVPRGSPTPCGPTRRRAYDAVVTIATDAPIEQELEAHRRALTGYCYRMLGSGSEAEDAVQETMVRAWKAADRLQARAALKSWLYRIASNVCFDMLQGAAAARAADGPRPGVGRRRRARRRAGRARLGAADRRRARPARRRPTRPRSPPRARRCGSRSWPRCSTCRPRQRAVLILREVLRWQATEVAELLDTSVASVNSALQRARATLETLDLDASTGPAAVEDDQQRAARRATSTAFERYDMTALVSLLREDAAVLDAAVPALGRRPRGHRRVHARHGRPLRGLAAARHLGQRRPRGRRSTTRTATAPTRRGRSSWSRRQPRGGSSGCTTSSTPSCSRSSGCRARLEAEHAGQPAPARAARAARAARRAGAPSRRAGAP